MALAYSMCLLIGLGFALLVRERAMAFAFFMLLANWGACVAWTVVSSEPLNWFALFGIDASTAFLLLVPAVRERAPAWYFAIVALCFLQLAAHLASALVGVGADDIYGEALSATAWAQYLTVMGGGGYDAAKTLFGVLDPMGAGTPASPGDGSSSRSGETGR